jgi:hypothetical protein
MYQLPSSNWSCILYNEQIVIHSEESDAAYQHFYPISFLNQHKRKISTQDPVPALSARVPPPRTQKKNFVYPAISPATGTNSDEPSTENLTNGLSPSVNSTEAFPQNANGSPAVIASNTGSAATPTINPLTPPTTPSTPSPTQAVATNPFPSPPWYPESAHFVRQWWPTLLGVPRVSCTVILMAAHDQETHHTRYAFAQHYFKVPFNTREDADVSSRTNGYVPVDDVVDPLDAHMMKMWYVSTPFEVVSVNDNTEDDVQERLRPLVAVDFGHAAWVEYRDSEADRAAGTLDPSELPEAKCLRFVTFPPMGVDVPANEGMTEGVVRTLELPDELDLDNIETINIDQSQGAVILSSLEGKIFFLFYT